MGAAPLRARAQVHGRAQKSAVDGRGAGPARVREARPSKSFFGVKAQSLRSIEKREGSLPAPKVLIIKNFPHMSISLSHV